MTNRRFWCVLAMILATLLLAGCSKRRQSTPELEAIIRTHNDLIAIRGNIHVIASLNPSQRPPTTLAELVQWMDDQIDVSSDEALECVDVEKKTITDGWGRPIVLLSHCGCLCGLASKGPNGTWEGGANGDIIVCLGVVPTENPGPLIPSP